MLRLRRMRRLQKFAYPRRRSRRVARPFRCVIEWWGSVNGDWFAFV
jgi:hypothetical protein